MKITKLHIKDFHQFKNLTLDFTYPVGHPLEGKPLKKACFIGQSGTGKTTLLNSIYDNIAEVLNTHILEEGLHFFTDYGYVEYQIGEKKFNCSSNKINTKPSPEERKEYLRKRFVFFLTTDIHATERGLLSEIVEEQKKQLFGNEELALTNWTSKNAYRDDFSVVFDSNTDKSVWQEILKNIDEYDSKLKRRIIEIIHNKNPEKEFSNAISFFKKENPNPRIDLAERCLNKILNKFHLELDTDDTQSYISVKAINTEKKINYTGLSTGTKQILLTAIPIFKYASDKTIYLFDEPERSLFPDLQQMLVDYYVSLAPDAQFFFATHSPVIASQFEPCERFILYFDEDGNVLVRNGVAPQGDDPNDILKKDFGMENLMTSKGLEMYQRYLKLISQSRKAKTDDEKNKLLDEIAEIAETYNY